MRLFPIFFRILIGNRRLFDGFDEGIRRFSALFLLSLPLLLLLLFIPLSQLVDGFDDVGQRPLISSFGGDLRFERFFRRKAEEIVFFALGIALPETLIEILMGDGIAGELYRISFIMYCIYNVS